MRTLLLCSILLFSLPVFAADKVRVFIDGQGTVNASTHGGGGYGSGVFGHRTDTTVDIHNEAIELAKDMREQCPEITITLKEDAADYLVKLNRESKAKRGLFDKNTQVLVANKQGDVIWTKDVRQVRSAAKDACSAISSAAGVSGTSTQAAKVPQQTIANTSVPASSASAHTDESSSSTAVFERLGIRSRKSLDPSGVAITEVALASPAADAGLHEEYVINAVNGRAISAPEDLAREISSLTAADVHLGCMFHTGIGWYNRDAVVKLRAAK